MTRALQLVTTGMLTHNWKFKFFFWTRLYISEISLLEISNLTETKSDKNSKRIYPLLTWIHQFNIFHGKPTELMEMHSFYLTLCLLKLSNDI